MAKQQTPTPTKRIASILFLICIHLSSTQLSGQQAAITPAAPANWNVLYYRIALTPDFLKKSVTGSNSITFQAIKPITTLPIDLMQPLRITSIHWQGKALAFTRSNDVYLVRFPQAIQARQTTTIDIDFEGIPQEALTPPFAAGWIWAKDDKERPFISITCEGSGAAVWMPCKNRLDDEPDNGISIAITCPDTLVAVGNGRLINQTNHNNGTATYT